MRGMRLDADDCQLLRSLAEQVLPQLSVRIARQRLACGSGMGATTRPILVVEALIRDPL